MPAPTAAELQQLLIDSSSSDNAVQQSVVQRLELLHGLGKNDKANSVGVLITTMADSSVDTSARRLAGSLARQLLQGKEGSRESAASLPLSVAAVEEPLLLAVSDADRGVRAAGAWCLAAFAKREFSNQGTGWPSLPAKLQQLAAAGGATFSLGAATCLALVAEDCGVQIVQAASDEAEQLRSQLLQLVVAFIDGSTGDGSQGTRRKAIAAATHFVKASTAPAVDLDDFDEDGEIHPEADGRHVVGRDQMKLLVATLAPRFVSFLESTIASFSEGGQAALAAAMGGNSTDEVEAAAGRWLELGVAVDGVNVMMSFEDAMGEHLAQAVRAAAALFSITAVACHGVDLGSRGELEAAVHGFGSHVLTLLTDVVIANDEGTQSVRNLDEGAHPAIVHAVQTVCGQPSLTAAFYAAMVRFGTRMTADEVADITVGDNAGEPDAVEDVNFKSAALRVGQTEGGEEDESDDLGSAMGEGHGANGLTALRNSTTWLLSTMGTTLGEEMLDALLPQLRATLDGAMERLFPTETTCDAASWCPAEGALLVIGAIFESSLHSLVQRGVAPDLLDLCVALADPEQCAAGPVRARACNTIGSVITSVVDLVMGDASTSDAPSATATVLARTVGARCTTVLGQGLRDRNKAVQIAAFEGLSQLLAHLEAIAEEEDDIEPLDEGEQGVPHPLVTLMPDATFAAIYEALCTNYGEYQLVARSHLYDLLAVSAEADRALAKLRHPAGTVVLLNDIIRTTVLGGLASVWAGMGDLAPGAEAYCIFESAALASALGRVAKACEQSVMDYAGLWAEKAVTIVQGIMEVGSGANGRDSAADDTLVAAALCLLTMLCDAVGAEAAFEKLLSPGLLSAAGSMCAAPLTNENSEAHKYAFALLGDFASTVGHAASDRVATAAGAQGGSVAVGAVLEEVSAPLLQHATAVFGTIVRTLFGFSEDHLDTMTNALWCCSQWLNVVPAARTENAFNEAGGLDKFMTMVAFFASNEGSGACSSPEFRENAVLVISRLMHMFPQHAPPLLADGLAAALAVHASKMSDPLERADVAVRIGLSLQTDGGSPEALAAALQAGVLVQVATAPGVYQPVFQAFAEQPRTVLKVAAGAISVTTKRSWEPRAKAAAEVSIGMWGAIAQTVLPVVPLSTKKEQKGFTKKELTALGVA